MNEPTTLFWDIGGVLLTNAWDHAARQRALEAFNLDPVEFEARHEELVGPLETHQITLQEYLEETVFDRPRTFSPDEFRKFMFAQSQPCRRALRIAAELAHSGRFLMATINNESLDLNLYRIRQFELQNYFGAFFSSCFLGARKPSMEIYRAALELTQRNPRECLFIDDRPENLEAPEALGMHTLHYTTPGRLRDQMADFGIDVPALSA